ncbi:PocR ligand-binding domain-containing protein [Pseudodesulfovibrio sp. zrk46]|uniref:PocR ligand-binding domain-containing protein n=1 Tax=Pseudodesulfovibrio sp. zrk46 TaxID=2725288 RepID=UPI0014497AF9|nr:PocR ligand-binding domain-containing protein [Pseudodesulfovibrio sp. zrk46]QJB57176.1 STAS domain-containing protein [Pseudodesulfovibrio sp. zrk46]
MQMSFSETLALDRHQKLLEAFCKATGIAGAIIDLDGNVMVGAQWQRICTDFHRKNEETCKKCIESDVILANRLSKDKKYTLYECKNGLIDAAAPIIVEGEHVANAFIGQFLTAPPDKDKFRAFARKYGFDSKDYLKALKHVPIVEKKRLPDLTNFVKLFAEVVSESYLEQRVQKEQAKELEKKTQAIQDLSTPVVRVWDGIVAAPLIGLMDGERAELLMERFLGAIVETKSPLALLDITGVPDVDTQSAQYFIDAVNAANMVGAEVILTGVSPSIAQTLIQLGIGLKGIKTRNSFADGLRLALSLQQKEKAVLLSEGV